MLFDTHIHTRFSTDSKMTINEAISSAKKMGIGIIITEHMDLSYPAPEAFFFDKENYFKKYEPYRSEKVRLGVELGMRADCLEANKKIVADARFDYIIGSIHVIDNIDIYSENFYRMYTKKEAYDRYFEAMLDCLKTYDFIHSLGHIDYISRYARYANQEIYYGEHKERIDAILSLLALRDQALEINTRRLNDKTAVQNVKVLCKRFAKLKGRLAVVGSDAHTTQNIGYGIKEAADMAEECGLIVVWFKNGRPYSVR